MTVATDITALLDPILATAGLHLDTVTVTPAGRARTVRVVVEALVRDDAYEADRATEPIVGLDLDAIAAATRVVGDALDDSDLLGAQPYTLEVTSPGVGRALVTPEHFRRNVGRLVGLVTADGTTRTGRVTRVTRTELSLDIPPARKQPATTVTLPWAEVTRGEVQIEFARTDSAEDPPPADPEEI